MAETSGRRGLGRGLSALLGEVETPVGVREAIDAAVSGEGAATHAPIELLRRNPDQPRKVFDETELADLEESIRVKGIIQPILVRPAPGAPGEYQIVAGERRWRAAQRVGLHTVPILVRELDDIEVLELGIIENVQRTDLNPIEEAAGYRTLMDRFGRTQEAVAKVVGKSRSHVANLLRLLNLPEEVRDHLSAGRLSAGHARAIASAPNVGALARRIVDQGLSVREAETLGRQASERPEPPSRSGAAARKPGRAKDADTRALEQDLEDALGLKVEIDDRNGRGEVRIAYATLEQLDEICRRLGAG
jgi:ParB family chromosome partitioning protein